MKTSQTISNITSESTISLIIDLSLSAKPLLLEGKPFSGPNSPK